MQPELCAHIITVRKAKADFFICGGNPLSVAKSSPLKPNTNRVREQGPFAARRLKAASLLAPATLRGPSSDRNHAEPGIRLPGQVDYPEKNVRFGRKTAAVIIAFQSGITSSDRAARGRFSPYYLNSNGAAFLLMSMDPSLSQSLTSDMTQEFATQMLGIRREECNRGRKITSGQRSDWKP